MKTEQNKQTILSFFEQFSKANVTEALTYLDDDIVWQAMGIKGELPMSGTMDKKAIGELITTVKAMMPEGLELKPIGWTVEDDRVAAEFISYGKLSNGKVYNNPYHFLFQFSNGKIIKIKEYMDTLHAKSIFID
ncbi:nuclear transport factor 2 family protein [Aquaticitalea lipolytica]|uniref:nuclear transport factor 2 family protein n=1 Tax=Aquaticitalea lipolytica TaxID=1247562 RepID=UPI0024BAC010|nr:nuclear transport factor 2 family protein [Aquaticitalea lipolytica]